MTPVVFIVAAHNEEKVLRANVLRILDEGAAFGITGVIIAENGSRDGTLKICEELSATHPGRAHFISIPQGDLGLALHAGLQRGLELYKAPVTFLVTAADLPFGFTDVIQYRKLNLSEPALVIGSKGHPDSVLQRSALRNIMSLFFRVVRLVTLGLPYRDTQGTLFISREIAEGALPKIQQHGFFFTTEFVFRAKQLRFPIQEVPVTLRPDDRKSHVRWFKTSSRMLMATLRLAIRR